MWHDAKERNARIGRVIDRLTVPHVKVKGEHIKMYKLICMSFDGDYVVEHDRFNEAFETIAGAWEHANDMGSKWYFYPFCFAVTESLTTIAAAPELLERFKGKRVKTVQKVFKALSASPDMKNADSEIFALTLYHMEIQ